MTIPASATAPGAQPIWLSFDETATVGSVVVGQGVEGIAVASTGATTHGGTLSWVKYFERTDHLGMHHLYFRQQYQHPALGRAARVLGTTVALHYGEDGSLRWVRGAQFPDVLAMAPLTVTTPEQAFAAAQTAAATWPGYAPGDPVSWPAGTLANLRARPELILKAVGDGTFQPLWRVSTLDANEAPFSLLVDASTGSLRSVVSTFQQAQKNPYVDCSPTDPSIAYGKARPQDPAVENGGLRPDYVATHPQVGDNEVNCGAAGQSVPCTHEAVWRRAEVEGVPTVPQIEVYHGSNVPNRCQDPTHTSPATTHGFYMRVGLKQVGQDITYDTYENPDLRYRRSAGEAMLFTRRTMETFIGVFGRCGFDGDCTKEARLVVDAAPYCNGVQDATDNAHFNYGDQWCSEAPSNAVSFCPSSDPDHLRTMAAAQDIVAHEWGHGVSKWSAADFFGQCESLLPDDPGDPCEMSEGFADVVGHAVEWLTQPEPTPGRSWETADWAMGEDWRGWNNPRIRRADEWDTHTCTEPDPNDRWHESIHATDTQMCERGSTTDTHHAAGNRLSVVFKLLAEGGVNPGCSHFNNCDVEVAEGIGVEAAAQILFRVLTTQADASTDSWDLLADLAMDAAYDLYHYPSYPDGCQIVKQHRVKKAFAAVGYPARWYYRCHPGGPCCDCPPLCEE